MCILRTRTLVTRPRRPLRCISRIHKLPQPLDQAISFHALEILWGSTERVLHEHLYLALAHTSRKLVFCQCTAHFLKRQRLGCLWRLRSARRRLLLRLSLGWLCKASASAGGGVRDVLLAQAAI